MTTIQGISTILRTVISYLHKSAKELKPIVNELPYKLALRMHIEDKIENFKKNSHCHYPFYEGLPLPDSYNSSDVEISPEAINSAHDEIRRINDNILNKTPKAFGEFSSTAQYLINHIAAIVEIFQDNSTILKDLNLSKEELSSLEDIFSVLSTELLIEYANSNAIVTRPVQIKGQDFIMIDEPIEIRIYDHISRTCGRLSRKSKS